MCKMSNLAIYIHGTEERLLFGNNMTEHFEMFKVKVHGHVNVINSLSLLISHVLFWNENSNSTDLLKVHMLRRL